MPSICKKRGVRRWRANVMVDGVIKTKWFPDDGKKSERAAIAWEDRTRRAMIRGQIQAATVSCPTVLEWLNKVLDRVQHMAAKTYQEKQACFARATAFFGPDLAVDRLAEPGALLPYFDAQARERSGNAANKDRKNLRRAWTDGRRLLPGWPAMLANPFDLVDRYPERRLPRYVPQLQDFWKVLDLVDGQDRVMLLTFLHLAARRGEIFWTAKDKPGLQVQDLDFKGRQIRLWTRKRQGGHLESDWLPMTAELQEALAWWLDNRPLDRPWVFYCTHVQDAKQGQDPELHPRHGQPFMYRRWWMGQICREAGVQPFGLHAIRHLTARHLHEQGYPVQFIQRVLRHRSAQTTERYLSRIGIKLIRDMVNNGMPTRTGKILEFHINKKAAANG